MTFARGRRRVAALALAAVVSTGGVLSAAPTAVAGPGVAHEASQTPPAPRLKQTTQQSVTVEWDDVPGAVEYKVMFRPVGQQDWWTSEWLSNTTYTKEPMDPGIRWEFAIVARDDSWTISPPGPALTVTVGETSPAPGPEPAPRPAPSGSHNGMWAYTRDVVDGEGNVKADVLQSIWNAGISNVYLQVGYPNPQQDPTLEGIVPAAEVGVSTTPEQVAQIRAQMARIDPGFHLWAWLGTFASTDLNGNPNPGDHAGHEAAQVDISTSEKSRVLRQALDRIASWECPPLNGSTLCFYGIQENTEDTTPSSRDPQTAQSDHRIVQFWNEQARTYHARGQKMAPFVGNGWDAFQQLPDRLPALDQPDFLIMTSYLDGSQPGYQVLADRGAEFIDRSPIPVVIDIQSDSPGYMRGYANAIDSTLAGNPKVAGYALYIWQNFQQVDPATGRTELEEWAAWHR